MRAIAVAGRELWVPTLLAGAALLETASVADGPPTRAALLSVLLPLAAVTAGRRLAPLAAAAAAAVLVVVLSLGVLGDVAAQPPLTAFLVLLVTLFNLGVHGSGPWFVPGTAAVAIVLLTLQVAALRAGQSVGDVAPSVLFLAGAFAIGRVIASTRRQAHEARAHAARAAQEQEDRAAAAVAVERARIAREIHDVLAHALTGIVVQASVEARLHGVEDGPGRTLHLVEQRGREALIELRRLLGLLREEGQGPADAPLPSLDCLADLLEDVRRAGHQVELRRSGPPVAVPAVDLAVYRLLQESLTNVVRHAPQASVVVTLETSADQVRLEVHNTPSTSPSYALASGGSGIAGMRERVRIYGGSFAAGPTEGGGFRVSAALPVAGDPLGVR